MKTGHYVEGLSNMTRLMAKIAEAENRGAREAGIVAVPGKPGFGKSKALMRLSIVKGAALVRAKAAWTENWAVSDICIALGLQEASRTKTMVNAIIAELMARPRPLIVDEINHAVRRLEVIETLRDISDTAEQIVVMGGTEDAFHRMKPKTAVYDRIYGFAPFGPATVDDVKLMCRQLTDVDIADDLVALIRERSQGKLRLVMNAIARVEAFGKKNRGKITRDMWGDRPLLADDGKHADG
jgi:DNA transposition AAA+ family ATPase